jgi:hypothetical protein
MAKSTSAPRPGATDRQPERSGNAPVFTVRHRVIKAAVWKNAYEDSFLFNTTITRSYKDDNDKWHESSSFGFDDLPIVCELLRTCYGYILRETAKGSSESSQE